jgi:hypothetical protein
MFETYGEKMVLPMLPSPVPFLAMHTVRVQLWQLQVNSPIYSSPAVGANGTIVVGTNDGRLLVIGNGAWVCACRGWPTAAGRPPRT